MRFLPGHIEVDLEARQDITRRVSWLASGFNIVASLLLAGVLLALVGVSPLEALVVVTRDVLRPFGITEVLARTTPLLLVGLAVYLPLKAGLWNIAGDAQIYAGGITAVWIGVYFEASSPIVITTMILGGGIAAAAVSFVPAYLRAKYDVNEILVTLLLSFAFINVNEYAIQAIPNPGGLIHGSAPIRAAAEFPRLAGRVSIAIFLAAAAAVVIYFILERTKYGQEIQYFGDNEASAFQVGINKNKVIIGTFLIGGFLGGIAGVGEIGGIHHRLFPQFSPGFGFTAIAIALLGRSGVPYVILASLLFGTLFVAGSSLESALAVPFAIVDVLEALVILFLVTAEFFRQYRVSFRINPRKAATSGGQ